MGKKPLSRGVLTTKPQVFAALGGVLGISQRTGEDYGVVENWKRSKTFPARMHAVMTWLLELQGLRADPKLWGQATTPEMEKAAA